MSAFDSAIHNIQSAVKNLQTPGKTEQYIITILSSKEEFKGFPIPLAKFIPIIFYLPADASGNTLMTYYDLVQSSPILDTSVIDNRFVKAEQRFAAVDNKLSILDKESGELPTISTVVQGHGNAIDEMIVEDKMLRQKIRDLSDRLDFHDRLNTFICSAFQLTSLEEQAKELYGLICPTDRHDEL
jgi:hypothetical protein